MRADCTHVSAVGRRALLLRGTARAWIGFVAGLWLLVSGVPAISSQVFPATGTLELAFSPKDDPQALILRVIAGARESIHVQAYVFTSRAIASGLVEAHRRGVRVEVLADAQMNQRAEGNVIPTLLEAGVPVAFETEYAAAHNKVLIVDPGQPGCAVVTGSYNFTWSAQNRNAENVLVVRDHCALVDAYLENWRRHRADAVEVHALPWRR